MRSVTVRLDDLRTMILNLGYVGENEHRTFNFDCKKMFGEYPSASVSLTVQPPAGDCYPATVERNGDLVSWTVTDSDLIEEGCGEIQLTFMVGEVVAKTCIGRTKVERSLGATGDIPTPIENWIEQAEEVISEAEAATAAAEGAAEHQPIIDDNGYWAVWDADAEEYVATEYKAQGTDGHDGVGIVSIEKTGTSGLVDTYTITFTSGNPVTYTVTNGRDADPAELIDDTAGAGDTNKVWSADKSSSLLTEINSSYNELKSDIKEITVIRHTDYDGYIDGNGAIETPTSKNEKYTDKVPVYPNGKIKVTLTYPTNQWMWLVYATYDNQGRFVSRVTVPNSSGNQSIAEEVITIPANIYYVAFSYRRYSSAELTLQLYSSIKTYVDESTDAKYTNPLNYNYASNITSISRSGMQPFYPPNSSFAFIAAYKAGFRTMLCPVRWTSDNIPVCLHDDQINVQARNTNGTVITDTIYIEDITLTQANQYDWGIKDSSIFKGMQLPTFESVVSFTKWMNCKLIVEIKGNPNETQLASMYSVLRKYNMVDAEVMFSASYLSILGTLQPLFPYSALGFGVAPSGITSENIAALKSLKTQTNSVFFHVWRNNETSGIITDEMINMLEGSNVGFALTEIQTDAAFESFIGDANNAYVTMAAIRGKPIEQYLYDHFIT